MAFFVRATCRVVVRLCGFALRHRAVPSRTPCSPRESAAFALGEVFGGGGSPDGSFWGLCHPSCALSLIVEQDDGRQTADRGKPPAPAVCRPWSAVTGQHRVYPTTWVMPSPVDTLRFIIPVRACPDCRRGTGISEVTRRDSCCVTCTSRRFGRVLPDPSPGQALTHHAPRITWTSPR